MSPHGAFSPQLVNLVIDEVGNAYQRSFKYRPYGRHRTDEHEALLSCTLVSKKWTVRSRAHLFKEVKIKVREGHPTPVPPASILPCIRELEVWCGNWPTQVDFTADLKEFSTAPIECLGITGGVLADKRVCIQECIDAHSATLRTIEFKGCSLTVHNIGDIVLGRHSLKHLRLVDCRHQELPPPGNTLIVDTLNPGTCLKTVELELCISADSIESPVNIVIMVAQLPYRFSRLEIAHFPTEEWDVAMTATTTLIKANANVLSSLRINIFAEDMEIIIKPRHLPSLEGCLNLSELTLDMEHSESNAVQDFISILSTLDLARSSRLEKIVLKANYVSRWFNEDGEPEGEEDGQVDSDADDQADSDEDGQADDKYDWEGLDAVLSELAETSISARGKRLAFTLVVMQWCDNKGRNKGLMSTVRKWLPKLLPRFNELGLLHVHYMKDNCCRRAVDDSCFRHDKPDCLGEDFKDRS